VVALDDFFPDLLSAFRVAEYNWYLECFPQFEVYSTNPDFKTVHAVYAQLYPQYADRIKPYDESSPHNCAFAYINFLNNAYHFLPALSTCCIPFIMTLYPGGGFGLGEPESDAKLAHVLDSPLLRGIIATQSVTVDYLKAKGCTVPVHYIYGGAIHPIYFEGISKKKKGTDRDSGEICICFVATRYMPFGENKGYPQFIEAAKELLRKFPGLRFSVVGNFDAEDVLLDDKTRLSISFKGLLTTVELKEFFLTQDIIISPNRPFLLHPGNFDGFPTGCCVEASLCGVAVVCSDELKLNRDYTDGVDIVICNPTAEAIIKSVRGLIRDPGLLKSICERGQSLSQKIFDPQKQLGKRSALLGKVLKDIEAEWPIKLVEHFKMAEQVLAHQTNHFRGIEAELTARERELRSRIQHIDLLQQNIEDKANHIRNIEKHIDLLQQNIEDKDNHIRNIEKHIDLLQQNIEDKDNHIRNIEKQLAKFHSSLYGRLRTAAEKLFHSIAWS
jgi:lipopolysaccharide transport system ATP-binding protein